MLKQKHFLWSSDQNRPVWHGFSQKIRNLVFSTLILTGGLAHAADTRTPEQKLYTAKKANSSMKLDLENKQQDLEKALAEIAALKAQLKDWKELDTKELTSFMQQMIDILKTQWVKISLKNGLPDEASQQLIFSKLAGHPKEKAQLETAKKNYEENPSSSNLIVYLAALLSLIWLLFVGPSLPGMLQIYRDWKNPQTPPEWSPAPSTPGPLPETIMPEPTTPPLSSPETHWPLTAVTINGRDILNVPGKAKEALKKLWDVWEWNAKWGITFDKDGRLESFVTKKGKFAKVQTFLEKTCGMNFRQLWFRKQPKDISWVAYNRDDWITALSSTVFLKPPLFLPWIPIDADDFPKTLETLYVDCHAIKNLDKLPNLKKFHASNLAKLDATRLPASLVELGIHSSTQIKWRLPGKFKKRTWPVVSWSWEETYESPQTPQPPVDSIPPVTKPIFEEFGFSQSGPWEALPDDQRIPRIPVPTQPDTSSSISTTTSPSQTTWKPAIPLSSIPEVVPPIAEPALPKSAEWKWKNDMFDAQILREETKDIPEWYKAVLKDLGNIWKNIYFKEWKLASFKLEGKKNVAKAEAFLVFTGVLTSATWLDISFMKYGHIWDTPHTGIITKSRIVDVSSIPDLDHLEAPNAREVHGLTKKLGALIAPNATTIDGFENCTDLVYIDIPKYPHDIALDKYKSLYSFICPYLGVIPWRHLRTISGYEVKKNTDLRNLPKPVSLNGKFDRDRYVINRGVILQRTGKKQKKVHQ